MSRIFDVFFQNAIYCHANWDARFELYRRASYATLHIKTQYEFSCSKVREELRNSHFIDVSYKNVTERYRHMDVQLYGNSSFNKK
jgi:hypothetical protein